MDSWLLQNHSVPMVGYRVFADYSGSVFGALTTIFQERTNWTEGMKIELTLAQEVMGQQVRLMIFVSVPSGGRRSIFQDAVSCVE